MKITTGTHDPTLVALCLGAMAVVSVACDGERRGTFRGRYFHAFESSAFTECGGSESWWTTFKARHPALDSAIAAEDRLEDRTDVYLVVEGRLSAEGSYGHLGGARRELTVQGIETVQPWNSSLCR